MVTSYKMLQLFRQNDCPWTSILQLETAHTNHYNIYFHFVFPVDCIDNNIQCTYK